MSNELASFLAQLADDERPARSIGLKDISDLNRSQVSEFLVAWEGVSPARRLELVSVMVEQAAANIYLNFHAALRACLTDRDAQVRRLAIEGLWEDERVTLVGPLTEILAHDPAADVRAAAATSLGRFVLLGVLGEIADEPARQAEEALQAAWRRPEEPVAVRRRVLESLSHSDTRDLHVLISSAYYHDDGLMRQSAVFAMGRSASARWNKVVLSELDGPDAAMRFEAAEAAGEMLLRAAVRPLIHRLEDPDQEVREAAALALGKIGGPAARRALEALLGGEDERLAEAAEEALAELAFNSERLDDVLLDVSDSTKDRRSRTAGSRDSDRDDIEDDDDFDEEDEQEDDDLDWGDEGDDFGGDDADEDDPDWDDEEWDEDEPDNAGRRRS